MEAVGEPRSNCFIIRFLSIEHAAMTEPWHIEPYSRSFGLHCVAYTFLAVFSSDCHKIIDGIIINSAQFSCLVVEILEVLRFHLGTISENCQ